MKLFSFLIFAALIIATVDASATISFSGDGIGSMVRNSKNIMQSGDNLQQINPSDQYTDGASGHIFLTAPGRFQYQSTETLDSSVNNRYTESNYKNFVNGGVFSDTASMTDNTPNVTPVQCTAGDQGSGTTASGTPVHQTASSEYTGILQSAEVDSATFISDANLSHGQQVSTDGAGLYTGDTMYSVEAGRESNKTIMNVRAEAVDHFFVSQNSSGGGTYKPEFKFTDFQLSDESGNQTVNLTVNETAANETAVINSTVEEA